MASSIILQKLRALRWRIRLLRTLAGITLALAVALGLVLIACLADYLAAFSSTVRLAILLCSITIFAAACIGWIGRSLFRRMHLRAIAHQLEKSFPALEGKLESSVEFLQAAIPGSPALQSRVIEHTTDTIVDLDLRSAISYRPLARPAILTGSIIILLVVLSLWGGSHYTSIALARFFTPMSAPAWPRQVQLQVLSPIPQYLQANETFELHVQLQKGDRPSRQVMLIQQAADGTLTRDAMQRQADGTYTATIHAPAHVGRNDSLSLTVSAGDDEKTIEPIQLLAPLTITQTQLQVTPPAYTQWPQTALHLPQDRAVVMQGSLLELSATFNRALDQQHPATLRWMDEQAAQAMTDADSGHQPNPIAASSQHDTQAQWSLTADHSMRFLLAATDQHGFINPPSDPYQIIVRIDQPPTVAIEQPTGDVQRLSHGYVDLQITAGDDFAVTSATLHITRTRDSQSWQIPLPGPNDPTNDAGWLKLDDRPDGHHYRLKWQWHLDTLDDAQLQSGDVLEYTVQVTDNFRLGDRVHPPVDSTTRRVMIISEDHLSQQQADALSQLQRQVDELQTLQRALKDETGLLDPANQPSGSPRGTVQPSASDMARRQQELAQRAQRLATQFEQLNQQRTENGLPPDAQQPLIDTSISQLRQAAQDPMARAMQGLSTMPPSENASDTGAHNEPAQDQTPQQVTAVQTQQQRAADMLAGLSDQWAANQPVQEAAAQLSQLLDRQKNNAAAISDFAQRHLGQQPQQLDPADRAQLDRLAQDQADIAAATSKNIDQLRQLSQQLSENNSSMAAAAAQAAQIADDQQIVPNQSQAAQQAGQNQMQSAQAAQRQAISGMQQMLQQLQGAGGSSAAASAVDAIREAYTAIRQGQQMLNTQSQQIDRSRDAADNKLSRADTLRLRQLSSQQDKLADDLHDLDTQLQQMGHMDFAAANKDISTSMTQISQKLATSQTGDSTQTQQQVVIQQLDRIINNLDTIKPPDQAQQSQSAQAQNTGHDKPTGKQSDAQNRSQQSQPAPDSSGELQMAGSQPAVGQPAPDIHQSESQWGGITPRQRQAILEGAGDTVIEKYRTVVEEYYRALSSQATQER